MEYVRRNKFLTWINRFNRFNYFYESGMIEMKCLTYYNLSYEFNRIIKIKLLPLLTP